MTSLIQFFQTQESALANAQFVPAYKRLQLFIIAGIKQGLWKENCVLPSERKIAEASRMSVGTVKRAMLELVHEGRLYRRQGSGTYVSSASFPSQHRRYFLMLENFNGSTSPNHVKLHSIRRIQGHREICNALGVPLDEEFFEIVRIFYEDGVQCILAYSYLPTMRFAGLDIVYRKRLEQVPLFIVLEEDYGVFISKTHELFAATLSGHHEATLLNIEENKPLLQINTILYIDENTPCEYRISYCITDNKKIFRAIE